MFDTMIRFFKELYLAEFTSFFKTWSGSRWSGSWKPSLGLQAGMGVAGVSFIVCIILLGISGWIEIFFGKQFLFPHVSKPDGLIISFVVYLVNYYILVIRGHGTRFEREFSNLEESKRTLLRISCWIVEIGSLAFIICSFYAYRHFFHMVGR